MVFDLLGGQYCETEIFFILKGSVTLFYSAGMFSVAASAVVNSVYIKWQLLLSMYNCYCGCSLENRVHSYKTKNIKHMLCEQ